MNDVLFAFLLTLLAGLGTFVGGLVVMFSKTSNKRFLAICLSFSVGVMLYISFAEIFFEGLEALEDAFNGELGYLIATVAFFAGIGVIALFNRHNKHEEDVEELLEPIHCKETRKKLATELEEKSLKRTGLMSALAIAIHNFPEGFVTFMAAMYEPALGVAVAIAIAIHNIPEGIAMASPIYYGTGSKKKALAISAASGMTEPLGGLLAWLLLRNFFYEDMQAVFGISFVFAAGIMVFVAISQLLPAAQRYGKNHMVMRWLFIGMAVIAATLVGLEFIL